MFNDAFQELKPDDAAALMAALTPLLDGAPFAGAKPRILSHNLSFYPGYELVEIGNHAAHPPLIYNIVRKKGSVTPEDITILNWSNEPVYELNAKAPLTLTRDNLPTYVRFFFTYIRGKHGRFLIIDSPDEIDWKDEPPPAGRKALMRMITPLSIIGQDGDGTWHLQSSMIFKDSLFAAKASVKPDGNVSLYDEELLVEDMPIRDDVLGQ